MTFFFDMQFEGTGDRFALVCDWLKADSEPRLDWSENTSVGSKPRAVERKNRVNRSSKHSIVT